MKISIGIDGALLIVGVLMSGNTAAGLLCLICAAVHELGHICAAKIMGIKLRELKLGFAGARIYPQDESMSYKKEFFLCAGGPLFSIIFSFAMLAVLLILHVIGDMPDGVLEKAFGILNGDNADIVPAMCLAAVISLLQAAVNLLPVEGLDGGRMTVALMSHFGSVTSAGRAEKSATVLASVILWLLSVYLLIRTGNGIGLFVSSVCMFVKMVK